MSGSIIWKGILTAAVLLFAVLSMMPLQDIPFEEYVVSQVRASERGSKEANLAELEGILERARARVADGTAQSVFVALSQMGREEAIDYAQFFPQVNVHDLRNLNRRNDVLLRHMLHRSRGKIRLGLDLRHGVGFTMAVDEESIPDDPEARKSQMGKLIEIMRARIDGLGVVEPVIRSRDDTAVEIQLPGVSLRDNPEVLDLLKKPARLEFRLVHRTANPLTTPPDQAPAGYEVLIEEREDSVTGEILEVPHYVKRRSEASGDIVSGARGTIDPAGAYKVLIEFTSEGGRIFGEITKRMAEENSRTGTVGQLAIVLDGKLYSAPSVKDPILNGNAEISGSFSQREVIELANVLNNPLQYELTVDEAYEVSPALAGEARQSSIAAGLLGALLVVLFMLFYYRSAGLVAVASVIINMVIVLGVLASLKATISLPGVAALVLTVGMAVDGQILIYERIREELRAGKTIQASLIGGFDKAFSTIVDANLTTLITALILIWLGTGPVKGFGVTLAVGIGASMFCALIVTRMLLEILVYGGVVRKMMKFCFFGETSIDFLKYRKPAFMLSWLLIAVGIGAVIHKGDRIYGIDFLGGTEVTVGFNERISPAEIERIAAANNFGEVIVGFRTELGTGVERMILQTGTGEVVGTDGQPRSIAAALVEAVQSEYPNAQLEVQAETTIGAAVSGHVRRNAIISVAAALLGILLYVALRFELGYGVAAVVALVHDVLMTIGLFVLLGYQFSAPMVAAILMVVGYSINDTIVVFDRIREELQLHPELTLYQVIRLSINRTLSRTVLTSATTLMAALALLIFGTGVITDFALIFILGILTGTFSSIFIANPVFYWWHKGDRRHVEERELTPKYEWEHSSKASRS